MTQAMASMAGLHRSATLHQLSGSSRLRRVPGNRSGLSIKAQQSQTTLSSSSTESEAVVQSSRRAALSLVAAGLVAGSFVQTVFAEAKSIKVGPPPPPSGGLPGTLNSDEPRDLDLPLKDRFFIQPLPAVEAAKRAKESAKDILSVKQLIDKKAWPYVQNDLRLKASYLRYDLNTVISAMPKDQKKPLKDLIGVLFNTIDSLDHAAKIKSTPEAEKYYAATVSVLNDVLSKIG
ncbi:oxygen-evolving enhancer protein 3-1, chloroplastic-like [Telopea speciosissima]|uniref:oxygen-evolving enhancer protein 3-1, chloroplastic-like n=1 Tax=Telopea speciosissima TaxID=54955 RepID=UPI001CC34F16|nr:oxygen-evolving enhancer protein 3-1, chloroplastic-like [Telopea speciosissima]